MLPKIFHKESYRTPDLKSHIPVLDGIRGIAILMVLLFHGSIVKSTAGYAGLYFHLTYSMWVGVDLFFVLSGFLITGILYDSKKLKNYFINFYSRRTLRIFPLYYLLVFFVIFIVPHLPYLRKASLANADQVQWYFWTYLSNFHLSEVGLNNIFLGPTWSLAIEEQFYLLWPLLVFFLSLKNMIRLCALIIITVFGLRIYLLEGGVSPYSLYLLTYTRLDPIAAGSLVALLIRRYNGLESLINLSKIIAVLSGAVLCYFLYTSQFSKLNHSYIYYGYSACSIFFASMMLLVLGKKEGTLIYKVFTLPILLFFGKYCYALYIFNRPLVNIIQDTLFDPHKFPLIFDSRLPAQLIFTSILILFSVILAMLSWNLYEKHFLKLKKYFSTAHAVKEKD